ncbi:MAG: AAA family ATPase [Prevotella sp.]|nr:AAA family ATPase [Prevotella sp.]
MAPTNRRKYPVGIQTFSRLRREGYVYVDKTDLVWQMATEDSPFLFLARPQPCRCCTRAAT